MRMQNLVAAGLAAGVIVAVTPATPARAIDFPYCTIGGWSTDHTCSFYTLEQCQAFILGLGGSCVPNPRATRYPSPTPQGQPRPRR
jgi:hypothetical protein